MNFGNGQWSYDGELVGHEVPREEEYHSAWYRDVDGNHVLALWFFHGYERGHVAANHEKDRAISGVRMNDLDDIYEKGFVEERYHDLLIQLPEGVVGTAVAAIEIARMDGTVADSVPFGLDSEGRLRVPALRFGESPVLMRFRVPNAPPADCL